MRGDVWLIDAPATDYIYDIETYMDLFCVDITHVATRRRWVFEVSDRINQSPQFIAFLYRLQGEGARLFGFNNEHFDWPTCQRLMTDPRGGFYAIDAHNKGTEIITSTDKWAHNIWPNERLVTQGDLFKIHHFDNMARSTSLKKLEINMRSRRVVDLPYPPDQPTTSAQKDEIIAYMCHDVSETLKFYVASLDQIRFRDDLAIKYPGLRDVLNMNDTKIGKKFFELELERNGTPCYHKPNGKREPRQTKRERIALCDIISPKVQFWHPKFTQALDFLKGQVLTPDDVVADTAGAASVKTKGFFTKFDTVVYPDEAVYIGPALTKEQRAQVEQQGGKRLSNSTGKGKVATQIDGFVYDFGTGGIHGSLHNAAVHADDEWEIWDWDVASYYPNLAISNGFFPAHLSETFCTIYKQVYEMRKQHPKDKYPAENAMLKLALNGVYGDSNNKYSPFYDPQYTMSITVNGQLMLCMLAEQLTQIDWGRGPERDPDVEMVQINTDGLTIKVRKGAAVAKMHAVCEAWQTHTGLELESAEYSSMFIRDVNSYIAVKTDGKLKRIGAYAHETPLNSAKFQTKERGWHQDHSMLVVRKAAEACMVRGVPVRDFIMNHRDPFDFMLSVKVNKSANKHPCYLFHGDEKIQNNTRYYVSTDGAGLQKQMVKKNAVGPSMTGIQTGWTTTIVNDADHFRWDNVNWLYYITEAEKLVI